MTAERPHRHHANVATSAQADAALALIDGDHEAAREHMRRAIEAAEAAAVTGCCDEERMIWLARAERLRAARGRMR